MPTVILERLRKDGEHTVVFAGSYRSFPRCSEGEPLNLDERFYFPGVERVSVCRGDRGLVGHLTIDPYFGEIKARIHPISGNTIVESGKPKLTGQDSHRLVISEKDYSVRP